MKAPEAGEPQTIIGVANYHPPEVRRSAPPIMRLKLSIEPSHKLTISVEAYTQLRYTLNAVNMCFFHWKEIAHDKHREGHSRDYF